MVVATLYRHDIMVHEPTVKRCTRWFLISAETMKSVEIDCSGSKLLQDAKHSVLQALDVPF